MNNTTHHETTRAFTILLLVLVITDIVSGKTIYVDANGTGDYPTIQDAINDANDGDIIELQPGTYTSDGNRNIDFKGKAITVRSANPHDPNVVVATVIDCQGDPNHYYRGFYFYHNEDGNSVLDGITITNGYSISNGGGIFCENSHPTIRNCIITSNKITKDPCDPYPPTTYGAGISLVGSSPTIVDCKITANNALHNAWGGGISCRSGTPTIRNCIISENSGFRGGGINCSFNTSPKIINCLIINNAANPFEYGGAIACKDATPKITNCTISHNSAGRGGAIDLISSTATITNCILWGDLPGEIDHTATGHAVVTYSDVEGGWTGEGNINLNPLFASVIDYHLVFGSPCIDTGTNSPSGGLPATDLDGLARPFDGDFDGNSVADMGAYEFHYNPDEPLLALTPARFRFSCPVGGPDPNHKILYIWNAGGGELNWQISEDCNWLQVEPNSGQSSSEVNEVLIIVDANGLASNQYEYTITVFNSYDSNNTRFIPVTFRVGPTLYVPADYNTIQAAIDAAFDGDEISVADGTYTGPGNRDIDFNNKAITVKSANGPNDCIIDCNGTKLEPHRGFYFHSGEDKDSIVDGFTITNGYCDEGVLPEGGGIFCLNASTNPTIRNCIITGNKAWSGGGISCYGSSAKIMNCTIINNNAYHDKGGGVLCWDHSNATITGCTIAGNKAKFAGGGIYFYGGSPTLTNSILWGNTANSIPQQIETGGGSSLSVSYCDVEGGWSGTGNKNINPLFVDDVNGDYHLSPNSPCIEAGNPNYSPYLEEWDIDGEPRVMGNCIDMGSDEISDMLADFSDNGIIDSQDLNFLSQTWLSTQGDQGWEEGCDLNRDNAIDFTDFTSFANDWQKESDKEAPTIPNNLTVTDVTSTTVSLNWNTSVDNVCVVGYNVYRDESYVGWTASNDFTDSKLDPVTIYIYKVSAYDAAYNETSLSEPCKATTTKQPIYSCNCNNLDFG